MIILLIILIYLFFRKKEYFQTTSSNNISQSQFNQSIELTSDNPEGYQKILSNNKSTSLDIDTNFDNDSMNINVGNSIISENNLQIDGKEIDIKSIRYIKKLPIHFTKEICLSDVDGKKECINKEHIDILKGVRPIQLITYPDNYRKCLQAINKRFMYNIFGNNIDDANLFTSGDCADGSKNQHFKIERPHEHSDIESHYHIHGIDTDIHNYIDTSSKDTSSKDVNYIDASQMASFEDVGPIGISEAVLPMSEGGLGIDYEQAILLDNNPQDNQLTSNELAEYLGVSIGDPYEFTVNQATLPVIDGGLGMTLEEAQTIDKNNDGVITRDEMLNK